MVPQFARVIRGPIKGNQTCFLSGPLVAGQRQVQLARIRHLLDLGVTGYSLLVLLPDRAIVRLFRDELNKQSNGPQSEVELQTYYALAVRLIRLFWPMVAAEVGFASPKKAPVFLNYESAQYVLGSLVEPLFSQGYFEGLCMRPQSTVSQLLDNANKAAINGFPLSEVETRLRQAWTGEENRLRYYDQSQHCIELFRGHCLQHGLLDASLVFEVFNRHLLGQDEFWRYFTERYRHMVVDSAEEMVPIAHDLIARLLPQCDSAIVGGDPKGGFRIFLGADADGCADLSRQCKKHIVVEDQECAPYDMAYFAARCGEKLGQGECTVLSGRSDRAMAGLIRVPYRSDMINATVGKMACLIEEGVAPGDMAIVAPHADGVLRFLLSEALSAADIPYAIVRRYEALGDEPVVRACLTLAALAHPQWGESISSFDLEEAFCIALAPIDRLRSSLLVQSVYNEGDGVLKEGEQVEDQRRLRVGESNIKRYEMIREWLQAYMMTDPIPLDHFLRRLFGEVLAGPHVTPESANVYSKLIASSQTFSRTGPALGLAEGQIGARYRNMIISGVIAAQHLADRNVPIAPESIAMVAPVHTYLLSNHEARYQFWLDVGSNVWWDVLHQPLTNHYVLSRKWNREKRWTDAVDFSLRNRNLHCLVRGLALRCRDGIFLCASERDGRDEVQDSPLLMTVLQVLQEEQ